MSFGKGGSFGTELHFGEEPTKDMAPDLAPLVEEFGLSSRTAPQTVRFYIASRLSQVQAAKEAASQLKSMGWVHTYDWTEHASLQNSPERWHEASTDEVDGVITSDILIMLVPGGRGTHVELGIALALGKPVLVYAETAEDLNQGYQYSCLFYSHPLVHVYIKPRAYAGLTVHGAAKAVHEHHYGAAWGEYRGSPRRPCQEVPGLLAGAPMGMYHCDDCGDMVLAGAAHPTPDPDYEEAFGRLWPTGYKGLVKPTPPMPLAARAEYMKRQG